MFTQHIGILRHHMLNKIFLFLNIQNGQVRCGSLQKAAFGVVFEPDFNNLTPLKDWDVKW